MLKRQHKYPGWNLNLRHSCTSVGNELAAYSTGIHHNSHGSKSEILLVREVAMMLVMERLTDKPNWHVKVFDDEIADRWKTEALAWPNEDLWYRISQMNPSMEADSQPKMLQEILSKESVDYVSEAHLTRAPPPHSHNYLPPL